MGMVIRSWNLSACASSPAELVFVGRGRCSYPVFFRQASLSGIPAAQYSARTPLRAGSPQSLDFIVRQPAGLGLRGYLSEIFPSPPSIARTRVYRAECPRADCCGHYCSLGLLENVSGYAEQNQP